jgi:hypothetical protein
MVVTLVGRVGTARTGRASIRIVAPAAELVDGQSVWRRARQSDRCVLRPILWPHGATTLFELMGDTLRLLGSDWLRLPQAQQVCAVPRR